MKEILAKIKAIVGNWHGHVDPVAAINQHLTEFAEAAHAEVEALKVQVEGLESRLAALESSKAE